MLQHSKKKMLQRGQTSRLLLLVQRHHRPQLWASLLLWHRQHCLQQQQMRMGMPQLWRPHLLLAASLPSQELKETQLVESCLQLWLALPHMLCLAEVTPCHN